MTIINSISLFYKDGFSDKEYNVSLVECRTNTPNKLYNVKFSYGRRGSSLTSGVKNSNPLPLEEAAKVYKKLVDSKMTKGYKPGGNPVPTFSTISVDNRKSGFLPQLLNDATEAQALSLVEDKDWFMQEKMDGDNRMLHINNAKSVLGINRTGLYVPVTSEIAEEALRWIPKDTLICGEIVGDVLYVFDIQKWAGVDFTDSEAYTRFKQLRDYLRNIKDELPHIQLVKTAITIEDKQVLWEEVKSAGGEGFVFKKKDSKYIPGRPNSGGNQLRYKFWNSATLIVTGVNEKRSVKVSTEEPDGTNTYVGNVSVPVTYGIPKVGDLVECRYQYYYSSGSLYQPSYKGTREDKTIADSITMLKVKS